MLTHWDMSSKSKTGTPKCEPCALNLYHQLQFSSISSNYQRWAPILNLDLQLSTVSSNTEPCAPADLLPNSQEPPNWTELSKMSRGNVQICLWFVIIYYYMLYVLLFLLYIIYFIFIICLFLLWCFIFLLYIICFLFLLYIILYYMYFIFIICYFILYKLP